MPILITRIAAIWEKVVSVPYMIFHVLFITVHSKNQHQKGVFYYKNLSYPIGSQFILEEALKRNLFVPQY